MVYYNLFDLSKFEKNKMKKLENSVERFDVLIDEFDKQIKGAKKEKDFVKSAKISKKRLRAMADCSNAREKLFRFALIKIKSDKECSLIFKSGKFVKN